MQRLAGWELSIFTGADHLRDSGQFPPVFALATRK